MKHPPSWEAKSKGIEPKLNSLERKFTQVAEEELVDFCYTNDPVT